jgi:lipopolysaccharide/colanic/teichoic acid biosynthesis glycosyltransferase
LLSAHHFGAALRRERLRSDRTLSQFAMLTLDFGKRGLSEQSQDAANEVLQGRVRESDIAGWLDQRKVGIILPDTSPAGAWKLADDLQSSLAERGLRAKCEVYVYPSVNAENQPSLDAAGGADNGTSAAPHAGQPLETLLVQKLPAVKRLLDVLHASLGLVIASPLLFAAAVAVKLTSRGPIFYAQQRDGLGGRKFWIYKFRTMVVNADAIKAQLRALSEQDGPAFKIKNDPRVTAVGRLLRRTCIDELPQLWNVLKGDMSLVGPRPMCSKEARQCNQWERRRLDVTPGLTCIWQVYGGTKVTFTEWMRMDLRYIRSRSFWSDLRLMFLTVPAVIRRDGVY